MMLDLTQGTPFADLCRRHLIAEVLDRILAEDFVVSPSLDPERDPVLLWLTRLCAAGTASMQKHGVKEVLANLLKRGEPYEAELPLRRISGVSASKGEKCMNLDSLPETMCLYGEESFGPLSDEMMKRLREAIYREFGCFTLDGRFSFDLQVWNGVYVAHNSGASRRFALWRRLSKSELIRAQVTPYNLDGDALAALRSNWRLIAVAKLDSLLKPLWDAVEIQPDLFWLASSIPTHFSNRHEEFLAIPYTDQMPVKLAGKMRKLHRKIDESGVLDVGRFLTEQISVSRRCEAARELGLARQL
jgi:hypothetical protein